MFGYINVNRKTLTEDDAKTYQAFYCGLCQKLKSIGGNRAQVLLNYDMAFLILLLSGLYEPEVTTRQFTCRIHPKAKKTAADDTFVEYAASMDIILSYHNLMDDYEDNGSRAKKAAASLLKKDYDRVKAQYPRQVAAVENSLARLDEAEKRGEKNIDIVSGYTGEMLAEIFCYYKDDIWNADLRNMGFYIGKFIYLMDAYEDREKDEKSADYNPLIALHAQMADDGEYETYLEQTLNSYMAEAARSFERMPIIEYAPILRNVLYSGVWTKYEIIQIKSGRRKREAREKSKEQ